MRKITTLFALTLLSPWAARAADGPISVYPPEATLVGPGASAQLIVTRGVEGDEVDRTRDVVYSAEPAGVVNISPMGKVRPLADGDAVITATGKDGQKAEMSVKVESAAQHPPINFPNEIVPLFSKYSCNSGGCHGKAEGQNGFKLSLFGFEPGEDYEHLVYESRGRRLFPAAPEHSLLIRKGVGDVPHGGGARMEEDSYAVNMIVEWMNQGMPFGKEDDPVLSHIEVFPKQRLMKAETAQQLSVIGHYSDGSKRDVTPIVEYESNQEVMAEVSENGLVEVKSDPGSAAVMIRFQGKVDVFRAIIPMGHVVDNLPPAKNFIDELVFARLKMLGLPPSGECDDQTFLRRVTIDIAGRIPTLEEAQAFAADSSPDKRAKLVDKLLDGEDYAYYFANKWNAILRNKRTQADYIRGNYAFHRWIRDSLYRNMPFDEFATSILAASGEPTINPPATWYRQVKDQKEQLQDSAQIFLGVRLQCAECHHHPYEKWSQDDYHGYSAFFSTVSKKPGSQPSEEVIFHKTAKASANNPRTGKTLLPTVLGGEPLEMSPREDPRLALTDWMGDPSNPFFSTVLVNRYWKHFFGRALVEPEDDLRVTNPASDPELLDALAKHFVDSGFDLKDLIRAICNSATYQRSAIPNEYNITDQQNFSRFYPRRLAAEVLLDSIDTITAKQTKFAGLPIGVRAVELPDDSFNASNYFLTVFGRPQMDSACECERTFDANLAQSLHLLNAKGLHDKIHAGDGTAAQLAKEGERTHEERISHLYQMAFARDPDEREMGIAIEHIGEKSGNELTEAYQDIVWALINTKEFLFNH